METTAEEPLVSRKGTERRRDDDRPTTERGQRPEEEEGAAGGQVTFVTRPEDWAELSVLEERGEKEKKRTIRPDGAEVVVPYRWPANQGPKESLEAYESRLAEYELEMFLKSREPMTTVALEKARAGQRKALRERSERQWIVDDLESQEPMPRMKRSSSPHPGPPTTSSQKLGARPEESVLKPKTRGIVFGGLKLIPTDRSIDPPPYSCFNCWRGGHNAENCRQSKRYDYCWNCGRRYTTVEICPRCAKAYARYMRRPEKKEKREEERPEREEKREEERPEREERREEERPEKEEKGEEERSVIERSSEEIVVNVKPPQQEADPIEGQEVKEQETAEGKGIEEEIPDDLTQRIITITKALEGLPAETLDLAIRQLLRERESRLERGARN
ncbi:caldesmon-like [Leptopilina heterotoma]|uniref:caldesmon-like n=1 Tax=Leptopilina heterotoma TaxID=63436 RepID=UPI001CA838D8|nr:caldesmon-like [Leptopilina heterotoma]